MTIHEWDDVRQWSDTDQGSDVDMTGPDGDPDPPASPTASSAGDGTPPPQLYYPTVDAFVRDYLALTYRRHVDGRNRTWCPQWWRHAEAIARLEALWRSWEHLRLDPATGASVWFRDHADPHMSVLLNPDAGPFKYCSTEKGHSPRLESLPLDDSPVGVFEPPPKSP